MNITNIKKNPDIEILGKNPMKGLCSNCGWVGNLKKCITEIETESWEVQYIKHVTYFCPACDEEIDDFYEPQ